MSKDAQTHYEVLGLTPSASQTQIRDAFLRLSKQVFQSRLHNTASPFTAVIQFSLCGDGAHH